jgi:two-component system, NtrC family, sensor histidine kinase HydH
MALRDWPVIVACVFGLSLVLLVIWRGRRSPLAAPLSFLVLNLTAWNFADDAWHASGETVLVWHMVDHALSPLSIPLAIGFTLVFVGRRVQLRWLLAASWVVAVAAGLPGLFALVNELGALARWGARFTDSAAWYWLNLAHLVVIALLGLWLLVRHARSASAAERVQARGVLAAMGVLVVLGLTEFLPGPGLGLLGFVIFTLILALVVLGPGFTDFRIPHRLVPVAMLAATFGVLSWLFVAKRYNGPAVVLLVLTVAALVALVVGLGVHARGVEARQELEQLAILGQFSDQLAHNLKNPVAALKGASEYLLEELRRGRSLADQERFVRLLHSQAERLEKVIGDYRKFGRAEPSVESLDLNSVVSGVLALQSFVDGERVRIRTELDRSLPYITGDPGLLRETLENLLRNAAEALPRGGNVLVKTGWTGRDHVFVSVQDDGEGMDARTRERLKKFYTTKPGGSGLGLAFARKVAESHGGELRIESQPGQGTTVTVALAAR